mmetsp:Transcript_108493/g.301611  ORF Transcript_108493/g.301611 Transcript_108493/m.301611 type:complete len:111 (+) Transcript_108493:361-693(+)
MPNAEMMLNNTKSMLSPVDSMSAIKSNDLIARKTSKETTSAKVTLNTALSLLEANVSGMCLKTCNSVKANNDHANVIAKAVSAIMMERLIHRAASSPKGISALGVWSNLW